MNNMLNLIDKLSVLLVSNYDIHTLLEKTVSLISESLSVNVCSIYLYDEKSNKLFLKANESSKKNSADNEVFHFEEGLVGKVFSDGKMIYDEDVINNKYYKANADLGESKYSIFLGVPIVYQKYKLGVFVIQCEKEKKLGKVEVIYLKTVVTQLALLLKNVELYDKVPIFAQEHKEIELYETNNKRLQGKGVSKGIVIGEAYYLQDTNIIETLPIEKIPTKKINKEINKLNKVLKNAVLSLENTACEMKDNLEEIKNIIASQISLLKDETLYKKITNYVNKNYSLESAIHLVYEDYKIIFDNMKSDFFQERIIDIKDILCKILSISIKQKEHEVFKECILVVHEMFPSYFLQLDFSKIKGIITKKVTLTSHSVILARAFNIPMITGVSDIYQYVKEYDLIIVDCEKEEIVIKPNDGVLKEYNNLLKNMDKFSKIKNNGIPVTKDGYEIKLSVNLGIIHEINLANQTCFNDVGLYRTEFLFLLRREFPSVEEQYEIYKNILKKVAGKEVTFRTLDLGGDKKLSYFPLPKEENPLLGFRSIRIFKKHNQILKDQLKALLRVSFEFPCRIMFPLINNFEDFNFCYSILKEAEKELFRKKKYKIPPLGIMVETPAAIYNIEHLASMIKFISVGTNDLLQYFLAFDRNNLYIDDPYNMYDPAFIKILFIIAQQAKKNNLEASICGEIAGNPLMTPVLIGAGFDKLSMSPILLPSITTYIQKLDMIQVAHICCEVLTRKRSIDIETELKKYYLKLIT